jgi:hypothetical protein
LKDQKPHAYYNVATRAAAWSAVSFCAVLPPRLW